MEEEKKKLEAELVKLPGYWEPQDEDYALFDVGEDSSEYQWVVERLDQPSSIAHLQIFRNSSEHTSDCHPESTK